MKLLFITRKYPPKVGGMEKVSFALANEFSKRVDTTIISWGKSQKYLPYFLLAALVKSIFLIPSKKIDHIHLGDALLSPLGLFLKIFFKIKTTVTVHGLDITFKFLPYQFIVPKCVARLDKIICNSNATLVECIKRGIPKDKCTVIPWGVYPEEFKVEATRKDLERIVGENLNGKKVIITVGRLIERKGVYWFIKNVFVNLPKNTIYLVIGEGKERERIKKLIKDLNLLDRVLLLGKIAEQDLKVVYNTSDLFVMPNIRVNDDMEGFGVVAIEAASAGLNVIGSNIEGIGDALIGNKTGVLIEPSDSKVWIQKVTDLLSIGAPESRLSVFVKNNYSWNEICKRYIFIFKNGSSLV